MDALNTLLALSAGVTLVALFAFLALDTLLALSTGITLVTFFTFLALDTLFAFSAGVTLITFFALNALLALSTGIALVAFFAFLALDTLFTLRTSDGFEPSLVRENLVTGSLCVRDVSGVHFFLFGLSGVIVTASDHRHAHRRDDADSSQTLPKSFHFASSAKKYFDRGQNAPSALSTKQIGGRNLLQTPAPNKFTEYSIR